jgi:hypothetical protein
VVDIALGIAHTSGDNCQVTQYTRFVSLDGVDWHDPDKSKKLYVGSAIQDYVAQTRESKGPLEPVKKETVSRVVGSAALKMFDNNYIALPRSLASEGTPLIMNNACVSWHELAGRLTFSNARGYIGTLFMVSTSEAHDVTVKLLDKHFGKPLPLALWSAQREVYGDTVRRPYIMTGVYPQRLRVFRRDVPRYIIQRLSGALAQWRRQLHDENPSDEQKVASIKDYIEYLERELTSFRARWSRRRPSDSD